jgi:8-oxo-dGTP pyrophosphatase MutT (NUDIX family)
MPDAVHVRHPLLGAHPILPLLAEDLFARPGQIESDDGDPARAAVAIVIRTSSEARGQRPHEGPKAKDQSPKNTPPSHESRVTSHEFPQLEVLLIQRAERHGDPWSGQIALPGGRRHPADATLQDTAVRETQEETGIDLAADGLVLGTLDEIRPRTPVLPPIIVTPFVAIVPAEVPLLLSDELADAFWVPWNTFADPAHIEESTVQVRGAAWKVDSYLVGERVVWGMTERMLRQLAERMSGLRPG